MGKQPRVQAGVLVNEWERAEMVLAYDDYAAKAAAWRKTCEERAPEAEWRKAFNEMRESMERIPGHIKDSQYWNDRYPFNDE